MGLAMQRSIEGLAGGERDEMLQGVVERVTFHNPQNGYTIARVAVRGLADLATVVGNFAQLQPGQTMQFWGCWKDHPQYGPQFLAHRHEETRPATIGGLEKYLGSGLIKGVGPVTARRIVAHFGLASLEIIESDCSRLAEVPGVGAHRIRLIQAAWQEQKAIKEVMLFLQSHQVNTTHAVKIFKTYGDEAIERVRTNPYQLAQDIWGIGFRTADQIAQNLGVAPDSDERLKAGILYALITATEEGHCYLPLEEMLDQAVALLRLEEVAESVRPRLVEMARALVREGQIKAERPSGGAEAPVVCFQPSLWQCEVGLARRLCERPPAPVDTGRVEAWLERYTHHHGLQLSAEQRQAVMLAAREPVTVLTGGPGTGKTLTTRAVAALWKAMGKKVLLASPTGRAAQRLAEVSGQEAKTIHRLLEFDPSTMGFKRCAENPLDAQAFVIDEASMIDVVLAYNLLKAIPAGAQVLLVGDQDQLPSVGPGNVLADLVRSPAIPTARLTQVFRQAAASRIITNAHRINSGQMPDLAGEGSDCLFIEAHEPAQVVERVREFVVQELPRRGFRSLADAQVLCPMNRGLVGSNHLNTVLQEALNPLPPDGGELDRGRRLFRVGDRVIQLRNNYDLGVFNGDLGTIAGIDFENQKLQVQFFERTMGYDFADLNELSLAYAISIHRSQGSEYPVAIIPVHTQHFPMLSRNLLYTGLTRARKLAVLVGTRKAIAIAVREVKAMQRYTRLSERLSPLQADE
ncbi:SF1B family DNA helicase RecD2 [Gloeobacter violaceus]|uniref:ATP-dependent RecD2 DNA helicase n=1 Tax=Gloeobacter violaceus (strain ATCC 29082 / PCC 7421) TaxID=251221 RepID=Q7NMY6_GLOVI|nr:ATP-dependent RecD-like DNA helicase [Gloeobacter violaceus]BAC88570.1 exodeoxyribonuclease V alpha chain [Gloeobacter violaceus PCC 7421]